MNRNDWLQIIILVEQVIIAGALVSRRFVAKRKPGPPGPSPSEGVIVMSKFKVPDNQPDFQIEVEVVGAKDSEGRQTGVAGLRLEVDNSSPDVIIGQAGSSTISEDGLTLTTLVDVNVIGPKPGHLSDAGTIAYKVFNHTGKLLGQGSDDFLVGVGEAEIVNIKSVVPLTPEPEGPPVSTNPSITSLDPASVEAGSPDFQLIVTGENFDLSLSIEGLGVTGLVPDQVSPDGKQLVCTVPAAVVAVGSEGTFPVSVIGDLEDSKSNAVDFVVRPADAKPTTEPSSNPFTSQAPQSESLG